MSATIEVTHVLASRLKQTTLTDLPFGAVFSDHMLLAQYSDGRWQRIEIRPYGPIPMAPSISALHYGLSVFEGQKAFRTLQDRVVLFRPGENFERFRRSCARLVLPLVPSEIFLGGIMELVRLDRAWVPPSHAGSLYIRPVLYGTDENISVRPATSCHFVVFTCPVGTYYADAVDLLVSTDRVRAFPGGTGDIKPAGNYATAMLATRQAQEAGYHNVLWLDGREHRYIEECGVMNVFFVIGEKVITPELSGTILPGVTRDSVIRLLRDMNVIVEERPVQIDEVVAAYESGTLRECFGTGTAATIAHVRRIGYRGIDLTLPPTESRSVGNGVLAALTRLRTGLSEDKHGWLVPV